MVGDRRAIWGAEGDPMLPVFGTRGTRGGVSTGPAHDDSLTLRLLGPPDTWVGNIACLDTHVERNRGFLPTLTTFNGRPDNAHAAEFDHPRGAQAAADAFLSISETADEWSVGDLYD
jgi:hypothetical protein